MTGGGIIEERARFAGISTRVLRTVGDGPPLVLLHGFSDSADTWRPLLRALRGERPAVAVDLPGFGRADRVAPGPYLERLDAFVAEVLRASASDAHVVAVGNSLGGVAVLRAAHDASLPLAGIVPISPAGLGYAPWVDLVSREPIIHHILTLPIPLPAAIIRQALSVAMRRLAYGDPSRADPDVLRRYASHHPRADDLRSIIKRARMLLAELGVGYAALESITVPVQMIWGERDILVPISGAAVLLDAVPGSSLVALPGVGHMAQAEVPDEVARLLLAFDEKCRRTASIASVR